LFSFKKLVFALAIILFFSSFIQGLSSSMMYYLPSIVLIFVILCNIIQGEKFHFSKYDIIALMFFIFWLIVSFISSIWAKNFNKIFLNSLLIWNYMTIYLIFRYIMNKKNIKLFTTLLYFIVFIYIIIAFYELVTWEHLRCSRFYDDEFKIFVPTGPFYNENNFAAALLLLSPFLIWGIKIYSNIVLRLLLILFLILILVILTIQGARIAMLAVTFELLIFFLFFVKMKAKLLIISSILVIIIFLSTQFPTYYNITRDIIEKEIQSISEEHGKISMASVKIRIALIKASLNLLTDTYLRGVGSGNYEDNFIGDRQKRTGGIINSHNFLFELLVSYGLMIFLFFLLFFFSLFYKTIKKIRGSDKQEKLVYYSHLFCLLMFIPSSSLPSSIRTHFFYWVMFAYIASYERIKEIDTV